MRILVITTGGTIGAMPYDDPVVPPRFSTMPADDRDLVMDALDTSFKQKTSCVSLPARDSKLIDDDYRRTIITEMETALESQILVTHGTDTLLQTADFFYRQVISNRDLDGKTIVLTGAMTPLSNGPDSDGYKNLSFSLQRLAGKRNLARVNIVLCDFDENKNWTPKLYEFQPRRWKKLYVKNGQYNRLVSNPGFV